MSIQTKIQNPKIQAEGKLEKRTRGGEEVQLERERRENEIFNAFYRQMGLVGYSQEFISSGKNGMQTEIDIPRNGEDKPLFLRITKESNGSYGTSLYCFEFRSYSNNGAEEKGIRDAFPSLDGKKLEPGFYEVPKNLKSINLANLL